jgi:hypothetical protein
LQFFFVAEKFDVATNLSSEYKPQHVLENKCSMNIYLPSEQFMSESGNGNSQ